MTTLSSFRYEAEMTDSVSLWLSAQGLSVRAEYATPSGPCDLVGFAFREAGVKRRLDLGQVASVRDVKKLALLQAVSDASGETAVSREDLARDLGEFMGPSKVQESATWLVHNGFLEETGEGLRRVNHETSLEKRIIAVEIKRRRVRDVLHQALQRRSFATETVIALPATRARAVLESPFGVDVRARGVGVLAVASAGCELLLKPAQVPREAVHPVLRALCVERFWNSVIRA